MGLVILCQQIQNSRRGRLREDLEKVGDLVERKWERQKYRAILETERGWEKEEINKDRYLETKIGEKEREREKEREGGGGRGRERGGERQKEKERERQKTGKPWEEERYQGSNTIVIIRELI